MERTPNGRVEMYYSFSIGEIWELDYSALKVSLLHCWWVWLLEGVFSDQDGMTMANLNNIADRDEPFILAKDLLYVFSEKGHHSRGQTWGVL
jgi:hypothetical protein